MPITPHQLFSNVGLSITGKVKWKQTIPSDYCGLYVISLSKEPDKLVCLKDFPVNDLSINKWLDNIIRKGKNILIDNIPATSQTLKERIEKFWLPDETILYIGKAGPSPKRTLSKRVSEYYITELGAKSPHAGGHWINVLKNLNELTIHYCEYNRIDIEEKEYKMLSEFIKNVSYETKDSLHDKELCLPFANKELDKRNRKNHSIRNMTA